MTTQTIGLLGPLQHGERRRSLRVTPDPFLIIRLPSGNQGLVLDLSPEGVGFLATAAVEQQDAAIRFEIARQSQSGWEAAGRLVWTDPSGKRGGLRFTHLPEDLQALIHDFVALPSSPLSIHVGPEPPRPETSPCRESSVQSPPATRLRSKRPAVVANFLTATLAGLLALAIWYSLSPWQARASLAGLKHAIQTLFTKPRGYVSYWRDRWNPPPPVAKLNPPAPPDFLTVDRRVSNASGEVISPGGEQVEPENTETTEPPLLSSKVGKTRDQGAQISSKPSSIPPQPDAGQAQLEAARQLLQDDGDPANLIKAVQLLWQAVEKRNSGAEIELAALYLMGRGVPKSCNQALVLLNTAKKRNSPSAEQKLKEIDRFGCEVPSVQPPSGQDSELAP